MTRPARYSDGDKRPVAELRAIPEAIRAPARTALIEAAVLWAVCDSPSAARMIEARMDRILPDLAFLDPEQPVYGVVMAAQDVVTGVASGPARLRARLADLFAARSDVSCRRLCLTDVLPVPDGVAA